MGSQWSAKRTHQTLQHPCNIIDHYVHIRIRFFEGFFELSHYAAERSRRKYKAKQRIDRHVRAHAVRSRKEQVFDRNMPDSEIIKRLLHYGTPYKKRFALVFFIMLVSIVYDLLSPVLIGNIQEETHRFAITYHKELRSKRLRYSELDSIPGIGPKRKQDLLKTFKSLAGIAGAELGELERILPKDAAASVYQHFMEKKG